jgi:hypothetical protein
MISVVKYNDLGGADQGWLKENMILVLHHIINLKERVLGQFE